MATCISPVWSHLKSARAIYNQWHGAGNYVNTPVPGGVEALEAKWKSKWRPWCSNNAAKQKAYSRFKKIAEETQRLMSKHSFTLEETLAYQDRGIQRFKYSGYADKINSKISR